VRQLGVPTPASITTIELALDTAHAATIAPVWAALLTISTEARGRRSTGNTWTMQVILGGYGYIW
jgi:hypothetical protein